jgi:MFS transporter, NNP family, nitrate/nitrite transporter
VVGRAAGSDAKAARTKASQGVMKQSFLKAGHLPSLIASFLYFDISFMVWVLLGPLAVQIARDLSLDAAQKGLMVATPVLAGAAFRIVAGIMVGQLKPKQTGIILQMIVILGLIAAWLIGVHSFAQVILIGIVLGVAGASFAVALPLASYWYPPEHQGTALGIAGAGNSGTVLAALFAPGLAVLAGWQNVLGLAAIPLAIVFAIFVVFAKNSPNCPPPRPLAAYANLLKIADAWWFMFIYSVTFGGFVGLSSSLPIYFNDQYGLEPVAAGYFTAACVLAGSFMRPIGGMVADRIGGINALIIFLSSACAILLLVGFQTLSVYGALAAFVIGLGALGMGNGAVFQLVPQRFRRDVGIITGLVGMMGGVGGFYLASSLGFAKQLTGMYQPAFLIFAGLSLSALLAISFLKRKWRTSWTDSAALGGARI